MDLVTQTSTLARTDRGRRALRFWSVASLVANVGIIVTGGVVRLTASGLGCPTWPRCTEDSYVTHPALGVHGVIEFGNRLLTFVLIAVAVLTFVAAWRFRDDGRPRRDLRWLSAGLALGIPAQGVIGGISVLTQLNPFVVALHLLASMVLVALAVWLIHQAWPIQPAQASPLARRIAQFSFVTLWLAVWLGTVVTGSGPHAGDRFARRTGFNVETMAHLHALVVYAAVAGTIGCLVLLRSRAALLLLAVESFQIGVGITQYHLGLPVALVALHLLGAALAVAAATHLLLSVRRRG